MRQTRPNVGSCTTEKIRKLHTVITAQLLRKWMAHQAGEAYDIQITLGHSHHSHLDWKCPWQAKHLYTQWFLFNITPTNHRVTKVKEAYTLYVCCTIPIQSTANIQTVSLLVFKCQAFGTHSSKHSCKNSYVTCSCIRKGKLHEFQAVIAPDKNIFIHTGKVATGQEKKWNKTLPNVGWTRDRATV